MAFDIAKAIESIGGAVNKGFSYAEKAKDKQSESEIIKTNKRYIRALNVAEELILLTYRYYNNFNQKDQEQYNQLIQKFIKYN